MQLHEKIRFIRQLKGWSQEEMAYRLNMSNSGYGSIERGETDVNLSRLEEIASIFGMDLAELSSLNEGNIIQVGNHSNIHHLSDHHLSNINSSGSKFDCQHELEKLGLINEQQAKEIYYLNQQIDYLKQQNADLREIINLLKK